MRIGITCYPTFGGSGVIATELGKFLARKGHEIHFISSAVPFRLQKFNGQIFFHEVEVVTYPLFEHQPYALNLAAKLSEVISYQKLDILHAHYAIPHSISAYLAKQITQHPVKIVTTLHGTDITVVGNDPAFLPITRFGIEQSDGVTAVSRYLKDQTLIEFNTTRQLEVIYNFIDTNEFSRREQKELREKFAPDGEMILIHISNFRPVKRVDFTIEVFSKILDKFPAKFILIGDGPERGKAEQKCRELSICEHTFFMGKQSNINDYLSIADLLICASETESFGMSVLEAISCGVPVIASNVGGIPEIISHGSEGFLVDKADLQGFTDAGIEILHNPELQRKMRSAGIDRARKYFDAGIIIPQYESFYRSLL
ncbi:N-acetyl-alpha-D-glucosaminyl L-malate synthase BshA [candidate division KSB1 bacterium]